MRLYKIFEGEELKIAEKIQQRRLQVLVHSYLYYKLDKPVISDSQWDRWAKELVQLQDKYPAIAEQVIYAEEFDGWDASTGAFFDYSGQIEQIAQRLIHEPKKKEPVKKNNILKHKLF